MVKIKTVKINVEKIVVPENCAYCRFFDLLLGKCLLFWEILEVNQNFGVERCDKCKQAEVEE
nr:MAG TPA: hypothetical protein [Caudoviricetes sp.]